MGSGGVMLPHYSPLKVAEAFSLLAGLYPGRIDLGLGRASGTDPMTQYALQRDRRQAAPDDFFEQLAELLGHLDGTLPARPSLRPPRGDAARRARRSPSRGCSAPRRRAAIWAAQLGLPYAFADFINREGAGIATDYQRGFDPGRATRRRGPSSPRGRSPPTPSRRRGSSPRRAGWRWRCSAAAA